MTGEKQADKRILVLAPTLKDAGIACGVLQRAGILAAAYQNMEELCREIDSESGAVLLTDEALKTRGSLAALCMAIDRQPKWSDLPLVLLCSGGADSPVAATALGVLHNVLVLDRPVHLPTLISAVQTALRSRERQFEIRDLLDERQRAADALRASEEKYRSLFENMDEGFALCELVRDADGRSVDYRLIELNPAFEAQCGLPRSAVIGRTVESLWPGQQQWWIDLYDSVVRTGRSARSEHYFAGLGRWYDVSAFPRGSDQFAFLFEDVSVRRRAEEALHQSEERLRTIIENSRDGINMLDLTTGRYVFMSPALLELTGFTAEEITNISVDEALERMHPEDREVSIMQQKRVADGLDTSDTVEYRWKVKSGEYRWFSDSRKLVRNAQGRPVAIVGISRDVTERKRVEQQLKDLNANLEKRVEERTAELERRALQLRQLATDLTLSEQRERQRLAMVLHDGLQQTLVATKFGIKLLESGGNVQAKATEITALIDDCIETSRSLTTELSPPILHKGCLVPALEWLTHWMHDKHGLTVKLVSREPIERTADEINILLFQSIRELLFNVVKHAGVRIARVEVTRTDGSIEVEVADDGVGFDPSRLESGGSRSVGMGLFSINERLSHLGGRMEIETAPGKGSRFRLLAPLMTSSEQALETLSGSRSQASVAMMSGAEPDYATEAKAIRVVLVDDHMVMRQGLAALLRAEGDIRVVGEASDGESALSLVRKIRPDVILMDIDMPGMDGIQATKVIYQEMPDIRIIGLSMFQEAERQDAILNAGAVKCLTKSGPSEAVVDAIRDCM